MSGESVAQRLEERKASFKAGNTGEQNTRRREEAQVSIRKQKRDTTLAERRRAQMPAPPSGFSIDAAPFDLDALLSGSPDQLTRLAMLVENIDKADVDAVLGRLLYRGTEPVAISHLVMCVFRDGNEMALRALVNITSYVSPMHEAACALAILRAGFLPQMARLVRSMGPRLSSVMHALMWEVVVNVALSCVQCRDLIMQESWPPASASLPFLDVLRWANKQHDVPLQSALIHLMHTMKPPDPKLSPYKPPEEWVRTIVPHVLVFLLADVQTNMSWREMAPAQLQCIKRAVDILSACICWTENREIELMPTFLEVGVERILRHLVQLCEAQSPPIQLAILELIGRFSHFRTADNPFHAAAYRVGVFRLLVHNTQRPDSEGARAHAWLSLGNYVEENYEAIQYVTEAGGVSLIFQTLRCDRSSMVKRNALFALSCLVAACEHTFRTDMRNSNDAAAKLKHMVGVERMLDLITPYVDSPDRKVAEPAVHILQSLLYWDRKLVVRWIGEEDADDRVQRVLSGTKSLNTDSEFYNMVCDVERLLDEARGDGMAMDDKEDDAPISYHPVDDDKPFFF